MPDQFFSNSQFGLWKKWFWIGIVMAIFNVVTGLVYGIALVLEKDKRKEGIIIIVITIVWFIFVNYFLVSWLINAGILPHMLLMKE